MILQKLVDHPRVWSEKFGNCMLKFNVFFTDEVEDLVFLYPFSGVFVPQQEAAKEPPAQERASETWHSEC
jgi:hypothetical protein